MEQLQVTLALSFVTQEQFRNYTVQLILVMTS